MSLSSLQCFSVFVLVSTRKNEAKELSMMIDRVIKLLETHESPHDIKFLWEKIENKIKSMTWKNVNPCDQHAFCSKLYCLTKKFIQSGNTETARNSIRCELRLIKLFYAPGKQRLEKLLLIGVSMQKIADKEKDSGQFKSEYSFMEDILNEMLDLTADDADVESKCKLITAFCLSYAYCYIETGNFNKAIEILYRAIFSMHLVFGKNFVDHDYLARCYHNIAVSYQRLEQLEEAEKAYKLAKQLKQQTDHRKPERKILVELEKDGPFRNESCNIRLLKKL